LSITVTVLLVEIPAIELIEVSRVWLKALEMLMATNIRLSSLRMGIKIIVNTP